MFEFYQHHNKKMVKNKCISKTIYKIAAFLFLIAIFTGELNAYSTTFGMISDILLRSILVLILFGSILTLFAEQYSYAWTYLIFFGIAAAFWNLCYMRRNVELTHTMKMDAWLGLLVLNLSTIIWLINVGRENKKKKLTFSIKRLYPYIPLGIICIIFSLLFLLNFDVWFKIDAWTYYSSIADKAGSWSFSFSDMNPLMMGGHTSYAYAVLMTIGELILPLHGYGQRIMNCLLSIITIVSFYFITEKIWGREKKVRSVLLTSVFAFAPLFYGISYLMSTDFPLLCFFAILLAANFYNMTFLKFVMILGVCFSKETGLFFVAALYIGESLVSYVKNDKKIKTFFKSIFNWRKMLLYSPIFLYALILFFGSGGWVKNFRYALSNPSTIEIPEKTYVGWHYPVFKVFEYFFMHFSWLIWILLLFTIIVVCLYCKKEKIKVDEYLKGRMAERIEYYIPIGMVYFVFCALGIAYLTYIHYRYVQLGHLFYVLCLGIIIDIIPNDSWKKEMLLIPFIILFTVESFITIDPLTLNFFKTFDSGNGKMISTRQYWYITLDEETGAGYYWEASDSVMAQHNLADGMEYNREIIGLQKVLEKVFTNIKYSSDKLIILDMFGGWESYTCAQLFGYMDDKGYYWDSDQSTVVRYETEVPITFIFDNDNIDSYMDDYSEVYYIDVPFNRFHENRVLDDYKPINSFSESYMRWKIDIYQLK